MSVRLLHSGKMWDLLYLHNASSSSRNSCCSAEIQQGVMQLIKEETDRTVIWQIFQWMAETSVIPCASWRIPNKMSYSQFLRGWWQGKTRKYIGGCLPSAGAGLVVQGQWTTASFCWVARETVYRKGKSLWLQSRDQSFASRVLTRPNPHQLTSIQHCFPTEVCFSFDHVRLSAQRSRAEFNRSCSIKFAAAQLEQWWCRHRANTCAHIACILCPMTTRPAPQTICLAHAKRARGQCAIAFLTRTFTWPHEQKQCRCACVLGVPIRTRAHARTSIILS